MTGARDIIWLPATRPTGRQIIAHVATRHGLTSEQLLAATLKRKLAPARHEAMWEIRQRTKLSLPQIATLMRLKDHTTILYGIRRHEVRLAAQQVAA